MNPAMLNPDIFCLETVGSHLIMIHTAFHSAYKYLLIT